MSLTLKLSHLLKYNICEESEEAGGQQANHPLVDGDDVLQRVDALLHGAGVDVVIDGGADAPHSPHCIHHRLYGWRDHYLECWLQPLLLVYEFLLNGCKL